MTEDQTPPNNAENSNATTSRRAVKAGGPTREDRLKAALKANMARRKAQARARSAPDNNEKE